jgi:two-component system, cell cycle sensor histidine kinase and response regulator CckA
MSRASELIQARLPLLAKALDAQLRESVFDNRYALHPRLIAEIGERAVCFYVSFLQSPDPVRAEAEGRWLAEKGLGERTVLGIATALRRFCGEQFAHDLGLLREAIIVTEQFIVPLLEGYITGKEALILKDQEQMRTALSTALESQSRELLVKNHAINTSINGIFLTDLDGRVTWVNAAFLSLLGYASPHEVIGAHMAGFWAGEDARRISEVLTGTVGWRGELVALRRDGTTFSVELSASLIRNEAEIVIGMMTSFMDITERKRLLTQIIQAQKMDALGQLAGGITHDFNNLLTAISGYLQFLLLDVPRDTRMHHDLMQIQAAVDRGTALTRQLRLFTRQTSGNRQTVSLNDVVRETWEILKRTFPPAIAMDLRLAPSLASIEADPNQMSQVLVNLCVNARDAMTDAAGSSEGGTLTVETENVEFAAERIGRYMIAKPGRYVAVRIRDTGCGISPDLLERLFVPFNTTKSARSGTGLGLAVVYGIVASHHGFIDVRSLVGQGTSFEILFPQSGRTAESRGEEAAATSLAQGHGTILLIDDEPQVREIMARVLTTCGYDVITMEDGRTALARFGDGHGIDLVVLDMMMPGMGGRECLARMKEADPGVRILVTTGYTSDGSAQELLVEGAIGIVEKPLDLKTFAEIVQKAICAPRG